MKDRLWRADPSARGPLFAAVACAFVATALWLAVLVVLARVVNAVFLDSADLAAVGGLLAAMAGLILLRAALQVAAEWLAQRSASRVKAGTRESLSRALLVLGPGIVRGEPAGELVHLLGEGVERLDEYVARYLPARYAAGLVPIAAGLLIAVLDPWTLPVLLFTGPLLVVVLALIGRRTRGLTERREREIAFMNGHFLDMLRGLPTLKLFGRSREQVAKIGEIAERLATSSMDVLRTAFQTSLVLEWGATAATALVAIEVSARLMGGTLGFEQAFAVLLLTPEVFAPLRTLALRYHADAAARESMIRIEAVLADADRSRSALPAAMAPAAPMSISFEGVTVRYAGRGIPGLDRVSFIVLPRRLTALVGPTGAGKSTVMGLLLRFLDADAGRIGVDAIDLGALAPDAWRSSLSWAPQNPHLFSGSVRDNLRLGDPDATDVELRLALVDAAAEDVVDGLPVGLDTIVGSGGRGLSGGQQQRLALARAFVRDAPLLLLDEPTSHLDRRTAARIRRSIIARRDRQTVLVATHDPDLIASADVVVRLADGRVVGLPTDVAVPIAPVPELVVAR